MDMLFHIIRVKRMEVVDEDCRRGKPINVAVYADANIPSAEYHLLDDLNAFRNFLFI